MKITPISRKPVKQYDYNSALAKIESILSNSKVIDSDYIKAVRIMNYLGFVLCDEKKPRLTGKRRR